MGPQGCEHRGTPGIPVLAFGMLSLSFGSDASGSDAKTIIATTSQMLNDMRSEKFLKQTIMQYNQRITNEFAKQNKEDRRKQLTKKLKLLQSNNNPSKKTFSKKTFNKKKDFTDKAINQGSSDTTDKTLNQGISGSTDKTFNQDIEGSSEYTLQILKKELLHREVV